MFNHQANPNHSFKLIYKYTPQQADLNVYLYPYSKAAHIFNYEGKYVTLMTLSPL
jgi:hypothetical protein